MLCGWSKRGFKPFGARLTVTLLINIFLVYVYSKKCLYNLENSSEWNQYLYNVHIITNLVVYFNILANFDAFKLLWSLILLSLTFHILYSFVGIYNITYVGLQRYLFDMKIVTHLLQEILWHRWMNITNHPSICILISF